MNTGRLLLFLTLVLITGCGAMGVPAISYQYEELANANQMTGQKQPVAAEQFMSEALRTAQGNKDSLSDAYQELAYANQMMEKKRPVDAQKLMSQALRTFQENGDAFGAAEAYYTYGNFYKNKNMPQNHERSEESFRKALELYEEKDNYMGIMKSYFGIGNTFHSRKNYPKACEAYERSKNYYLKAMEVNPSEKVQMNPNFKDPGAMIDGFMKSINCDQRVSPWRDGKRQLKK